MRRRTVRVTGPVTIRNTWKITFCSRRAPGEHRDQALSEIGEAGDFDDGLEGPEEEFWIHE